MTAKNEKEKRTEKVISKDGTSIAYEKAGTGPPLILVDGALCHRAFGPTPKLRKGLEKDFTVFTYDRVAAVAVTALTQSFTRSNEK